ncbi:chemotaxis protein CheW [Yoonia sediminilitoris]|uniref:Purine-binding chemotaxis protein CheW n=1 Tax=Yoonia sediminilitoris TaxID=1286148 RepID=A0A2T6KKF1_9RHOB|nr:chemotaxis protein CheW [Yoonia sediminilitoris]PUB16441.1 purine-binding chemotaxis protein CheW [Yoonia sediminilitoris]RCW96790.1 purine-binding chemotaxis protein CheW [Yoonia sediminilitoris]
MQSALLRSEVLAGTQSDAGEETNTDGLATYLLFGMGTRNYATDVSNVREIVDLAEIRPIPNAPHDVFGMIDLRSQSIPVIDLAARMQVEATPETDARIIVFEFGTPDTLRCLGIIADRVISVSEIATGNIETLTHAISGWQGDGVVGVIRSGDMQSLVLRIEHYLNAPDLPGEFDFGDG